MSAEQPLSTLAALPACAGQVAIPSTLRFAPLVLLALLCCSLIASLALPWVQTARADGAIAAFDPQAREQPIQAPLKGRVVRWFAVEGERVSAGDPLVELGDNDPEIIDRLTRELSAASADLANAELSLEEFTRRISSLERARAMALEGADARIRMARQDVRAAEMTLKAQRGELTAAQLNLQRQEALADKGLASEQRREQSRASEIRADAALTSALARVEEARGKVLAARADREQRASDFDVNIAQARSALLDAQTKRASADARVARAQSELSRQKAMFIKAPISGILKNVSARQNGAFVSEGTSLATIVPDGGELAVALYVRGLDASLVIPGRRVRLQFEGWPAVQFSGWPNFAVGTFGGVVAFVDPGATPDGRVRVVIKPDPEDRAWPPAALLRQGTRAQGWILLDEVSIAFELWRQFNAFPPSPPKDTQAILHSYDPEQKEE